jgi:hypothetical protein
MNAFGDWFLHTGLVVLGILVGAFALTKVVGFLARRQLRRVRNLRLTQRCTRTSSALEQAAREQCSRACSTGGEKGVAASSIRVSMPGFSRTSAAGGRDRPVRPREEV